MNKQEIEEEVIEGRENNHWRNWISTGDLISLLVMAIALVASYTKLSLMVADIAMKQEALNAVTVQLHEALDQLRMSRSMTPEAAQRISVLEARVQANEMSVSSRLTRIEDKVDELLERKR